MMQAKVPLKKLFIFGLFLPLIAPVFMGAVYSLLFVFSSETKREGLILLAWSIFIAIISVAMTHWGIASGHIIPPSQSL